MGLKDQFNRFRNYFVEDDDDDYGYDEEYERQEVSEEKPVSVKPQVKSTPQSAQVRPSRPQETTTTQTRNSNNTTNTVSSPSARRPLQQPVQSSYTTQRSASGMNSGYVSAPAQPTILSRTTNTAVSPTINIKEPRVYQDVMELASVVKAGQSVLINFKNMADQQARRSIDFLTGVAYIVDGDIQNIGGQIFLVTPTGVTVEGAKELSILSGGGQNFETFDLTY